MTIKLNTAALNLLLDSKEGPVGREIQRRAEAVVEQAKTNAKVIMHRRPNVVDQEVGYHLGEDLRAVIGISDTSGIDSSRRKSISRYLAEKEAREQVWLIPALRDVFAS